MPLFDRLCPHCGWQAIDVWEKPQAPAVACPECGGETRRAWLTRAAAVIGDEMDHTQVNGTREPIHFTSKQERKRWLKEQGYRENDAHVGQNGTDKSTLSTKWVTGGKQWLADAETLAQRHGTFKGNQPEPDPSSEFHITWRTGELTKEQAAEYGAVKR